MNSSYSFPTTYIDNYELLHCTGSLLMQKNLKPKWVPDALKDLRGRFSIWRKYLPFSFQILSKMLLMCFFFLIKETLMHINGFFNLNSTYSFLITYIDNFELLHCTGSVQLYSVIWFCFEAFEISEADLETLLHSIWNTFQHSLAVSGY